MPRPLVDGSGAPNGINGILQNGWADLFDGIPANSCYAWHTMNGSRRCRPCVAGFVAFFIAQSLKVITHWYSEGRWDFTRVIGSGGMPSSHTACVSLHTLLIHAKYA